MGKYIIVPITRNGVLERNLFPVIDIVDIELDSLIESNRPMEELTSKPGWYKFYFSSFREDKNYAITIDAGDTLPDGERYYYAANDGVSVPQTPINLGPPTASF